MSDEPDQQDPPWRHDIVARLDRLIAQGVVLDEGTENFRRSCQAEPDPAKVRELVERFNAENVEIMQREFDYAQRMQDLTDWTCYLVLLCGCIYFIGMVKTVLLIVFGVILVFVLMIFFDETEDGEADAIPGELFWAEYGWLVVHYAAVVMVVLVAIKIGLDRWA